MESDSSRTKANGMARIDETFSTTNGSEDDTLNDYSDLPAYDDGFPSVQTFSGSQWLTEAVEELAEDPSGWGPVAGVEARFLNLKELYVGRRFASGASGRLYEGKYRNRDVAVKILRPPANEQDKKKLDSEFKQEVTLLYSMDHPNVVELIGACCKEGAWCMVTEYLSGGNLKNFLRSKEEPLSWTMVIDFACDIANAMEYLHKKGIIHRDLKSDNMVFSTSGVLKLTDFVISRLADVRGEMTAEMGTFRWMAPEVIDHLPYTEKVDVYSFGIVLWEMITREQPFSGMTPIQAAFAVVSKNARPIVPDTTIGSLGELIENCWQADYEKRPSFTDIIETLKMTKKNLISNPESLRSFKSVKSQASQDFSRSITTTKSTEVAKPAGGGCCTIL